MLRRTIKLYGLKKCGAWGKATKPCLKRIANKASRRYIKRMTYSIHQTEKDINPFSGGASL